MRQRFRTLLADPPWKFGDALPGPKRGSSKHYDVMTVDEIASFPLPSMFEDSLLFLWRVASMTDEAMHVVRAWGFEAKAEIVWVKETKAPLSVDGCVTDADLVMGMGRYVRNCHETCIVAAKGAARDWVLERNVRSVFFAPRQEHSRKPDAFYGIVERIMPGPRVELFARQERAGWVSYGRELEGRPDAP